MLKEIVCSVSMLTGHHACPDEKVIPVQCTTEHGVVVCRTHAGTEGGKTHINGSVEKGFGAGSVSASSVHLDITAKRRGKVIRTVATEFSPRTIPESRQGVQGRSWFALKIGELPPDAEISVTVHKESIQRCEHFRKK